MYQITSNGGNLAPAEFDFRSDIVTVPTQEMLDAVLTTTFKDDVYREDKMTENFQAEMASLTGHEDGIFMLSGTMSNQLGLRALLMQPPYSVLTDSRGHIVHYEAGGLASLTGASLQPVLASNGKYLTLEDIQAKAILDEYVQYSPTRVISLENTLNGLVMPLEEVRRISSWAHQNGIKMHLDGARLWDAVVAGAGSLFEYAQEFDTVNLCFSKGLGAPLGSVLVGSKKTIAAARKIRQSIGGGMHQAGVLTAMARVSVRATFGTGADGKGSLLARSHQNALHIAELWVRSGGKLLGPTETCMVFLDIKDAGISRSRLEELSAQHGLVIKNERLVVHYRVSLKSKVDDFPLTTSQKFPMKLSVESKVYSQLSLKGRCQRR
ncbi:threonine aldolase [Exophiala aquamarina CBS 119918]|uniref:Threonine aldolase n=1 Tax=Exophiala aquamarina CBS 119918 TaxID=1182545 RepID=A0A072PTF9_9EURO|nr:threonine aldolase [Exophiala aquamarina CBS 119918]KEF63161.1 threonine aldolase [Exophiala aquamarina CBS 119918]